MSKARHPASVNKGASYLYDRAAHVPQRFFDRGAILLQLDNSGVLPSFGERVHGDHRLQYVEISVGRPDCSGAQRKKQGMANR